jgi:hypothetical protein
VTLLGLCDAKFRLGQGETVAKFGQAASATRPALCEVSSMTSRDSFASLLMACGVTLGLASLVPLDNAAGAPLLKPGESASNDVIEIKDSSRGPAPIAPSYLAYDWPYYFGRGHYPTHIGPGYVYYGYPYTYRTSHYRRYGGGCSYWPAKSVRRAWTDARKCIGN